MSNMMNIPNAVPYQKDMAKHQEKNPTHKNFKVYGNKKREKLQGAFCVKCKKFISSIKVR